MLSIERRSTASMVLGSLRDLEAAHIETIFPSAEPDKQRIPQTKEGRVNLREALRARRFLEDSGLVIALFELNQDILHNKGKVVLPEIYSGDGWDDPVIAESSLSWKIDSKRDNRPYYLLRVAVQRSDQQYWENRQRNTDKRIEIELSTAAEPGRHDSMGVLYAEYELPVDFNFGYRPSEAQKAAYKEWFSQNVARFITRIRMVDEFFGASNPLFLSRTDLPGSLSVRLPQRK